MTKKSVGLKYDDNKLRYDLLPFDSLDEIVKVITHGAKKYGENNWKELDNAIDRYTGALLRHLSSLRQGEINDPDSKLMHISHIACNALFLIHFYKGGIK